MPRTLRTDIGSYAYHVLNRANARVPIFTKDGDYRAFETVLADAQARAKMPILSYTVMPNHWHMVLYPPEDGMLAPFMHWLTLLHAQRWHKAHGTEGTGHLYQARYKSFVIETDTHLLRVLRYIERNPVRAGLVARAEAWRWSSLWRRLYGTETERGLLAPWPIPEGSKYLAWVNEPEDSEVLEAIRTAANRGSPYGADAWRTRVIEQLGLQATVRTPGRPRAE